MARGLVAFDRGRIKEAANLTGIDEAGRGCLAGPVVAAAVRCSRAFYSTAWCRKHARGVDDSKRLSAKRRAAIVDRFKEACHEEWIHIGMGLATVEEIERHNIFGATVLAMRRALDSVHPEGEGSLFDQAVTCSGPVLVDGRPIRRFPCAHEGIVKGDRKSLAIALAGIHAKEYRDSIMMKMDQEYPQYGFVDHKGYGTKRHLLAILEFGPAACHRPSFLVKLKARREERGEAFQDSLF